MEHYRCVNDLFNYCTTGEGYHPERSEPNPGTGATIFHGSCTKNPAECGSHVTSTQKSLDNPHKTESKPPQVKKKGIKKKK